MKSFKKQLVPIFLFTGILLLALFLRLYHLDSVPPSPLHDEVSNGYNAYSLLKTGADEFGTRFPLLLRAYDDWRPALFTYFSIPFVYILGLSVFSIRLPSIILSLASLILLGLLISELIAEKDKSKISVIFTFSTAFLFAVSPWTIYFSRISNEANLSLFFLLGGLLTFFKFINRRKSLYFITSAVFFGLSFDSYNAIKIFIPLFFISLLLIFYQGIKNKSLFFIGVLAFLITTLPFILMFLNPNSSIRLTDVSIFSQPQNYTSKSASRLVYDNANHDIFGKFIDNRRVDYFYTFTNNYLANLNPLWLFTDFEQTDKTYFKIPNFGLFYLFELPLLLFGFYVVSKNNLFSRKVLAVLILWIVLGIIPSAITIESPHATRTLHILPAYLIFQGIGLGYLLIVLWKVKKRVIGLILLLLTLLTIAFSIIWFFHAYFVNFPREDSSLFEYGIYQALDFAKLHENEYAKIQISTEYNAIRSSNYYLFKESYSPYLYQKSGGSISGYYAQSHTIGKYYFTNPNFVYYINGNQEVIEKNFYSKDSVKTLYIISPTEYPQSKIGELNQQNFKILKKIKYFDGSDALWIIQKI